MTRPTLIIAIRCVVLAVACAWLYPSGFGWLPLALMMPPSLLTVTHTCTGCDANTARDQYQVVITGVTSGFGHPSCTGANTCAADWNKTFLFTYSFSSGGFCTYECPVSICSGCTGPTTNLQMGINVGFSMVPSDGTACNMTWTDNTQPTPRDCSTPSPVSIPYVGASGFQVCDGSASTFTVQGV